MQRGSSGATIEHKVTFTAGDGRNVISKQVPCVLKKDSNGCIPVVRQANWLRRYSSVVLPRVIGIGDSSYMMERLDDTFGTTSPDALAVEIITQLRCHLWNMGGTFTAFDEGALWRRIDGLQPGVETLQWLSYAWESFAQHECDIVVTHGDPTFDNVMRRGTQLVLVDPYPSEPALPNWKMLDVGRVLQSLFGYEAARYGADSPWALSCCDHEVIRFMFTERQYNAAVFWAVVHLLRARKRAPEDTWKAITSCIELAMDSLDD